MALIASFLCGLLFGGGLIVSQMTDPQKVLGFLDVLGTWDPSLAIVMAAALAVALPGFRLAARQPRPVLDDHFIRPSRSAIEGRLVAGAALFGVGWGLVGLCPGPALVDLVTLSPAVAVFVAAMAAGIFLHDRAAHLHEQITAEALAAEADG